jgi:hypothetical protein
MRLGYSEHPGEIVLDFYIVDIIGKSYWAFCKKYINMTGFIITYTILLKMVLPSKRKWH